MAAKKAPAKKMAAKKIQDPQRPKPPKRTDAAGRSGMGESAMSNIKRGAFYPGSATPADMNARGPGVLGNSSKVWNAQMNAAEKYAYKRQQDMNPRRDMGARGSGSGEAGFGNSYAAKNNPMKKATGKAISASRDFRPKKKK